MVAVLLLLGAALRAVTQAAYWPALFFPDSVRYLEYSHNFAYGHWTVDDQRQSGYSILITPAVAVHAIWLIPLIQHVGGLASAFLIYAILLRLRAKRWLAALATIPVLFDPLQLILEQYVLTDVWTVFLVLAALALLVWGYEKREKIAGLLLGIAVAFRDEELIMIVPAVIYAARRWLALVICFLIPVVAYLGWFDATRGELNFTTFSGAFLYGRVADFADCAGLTLPAYEKPLCPTQPPAQRVADFYTWNPASPQWTFTVPPGMSRDAVVQDFSLKILEHQPLAYAEAVAKDFLYGFSPVRGAGPEHYSPSYLEFHRQVPPDPQAEASLHTIGIGWPRTTAALAGFLQGYWFYVPGPLLAAGLVLGLAGGIIRRHKEALLFCFSAIAVLIPPAVFATFDWRYQLPQLTLIPVAAVLGVTALTATAGTAAPDRPASAAEDLPVPPTAR
jgi:hypothetical protein